MDEQECIRLILECVKNLDIVSICRKKFNSGGIDTKKEYKGIYVLPKIILSSALQELANEYKDSMKKIGYGEEVDNLKHF